MTAELRHALRLAIDARRRELEQVPTPCPIGKGNNTGYKAGCRCHECVAASTTARREYRRAHREQENERERQRRRRKREQREQQRALGAT